MFAALRLFNHSGWPNFNMQTLCGPRVTSALLSFPFPFASRQSYSMSVSSGSIVRKRGIRKLVYSDSMFYKFQRKLIDLYLLIPNFFLVSPYLSSRSPDVNVHSIPDV